MGEQSAITRNEDGREIRVPDADHPISIDPDTVRVVARVGHTIIAETRAALAPEAGYPRVHCIPLDDTVPGMLRDSSQVIPSVREVLAAAAPVTVNR